MPGAVVLSESGSARLPASPFQGRDGTLRSVLAVSPSPAGWWVLQANRPQVVELRFERKGAVRFGSPFGGDVGRMVPTAAATAASGEVWVADGLAGTLHRWQRDHPPRPGEPVAPPGTRALVRALFPRRDGIVAWVEMAGPAGVEAALIHLKEGSAPLRLASGVGGAAVDDRGAIWLMERRGGRLSLRRLEGGPALGLPELAAPLLVGVWRDRVGLALPDGDLILLRRGRAAMAEAARLPGSPGSLWAMAPDGRILRVSDEVGGLLARQWRMEYRRWPSAGWE